MSHYWLPVVRSYAERNGIAIRWHDNSWLKISLTTDQARAFLDEAYDGEPPDWPLVDGEMVELESEEY